MSFEADPEVPDDAALPDENVKKLGRDFQGNQDAEKVFDVKFSYLLNENRSSESEQQSSSDESLSSSIASGSSIAFTIEDPENYNYNIPPSSQSSL